MNVTISGRVQGVGYRAWTVGNARDLGLTGWVRNRRDGSVEALFQGEASRLEEMLQRCQDGPLAARVTEVKTVPAEAECCEGFHARETV